MSALLVGVLVVMVSAVGFGAAMFGRRPIPQSAMRYAGAPLEAVTTPSRSGAGSARRPTAAVDDRPAEERRAAMQVDIPASVRMRSMFLLAVGVVGFAAVLGVVLSVVVVGFFTLIN
jgi:hypothetical protein